MARSVSSTADMLLYFLAIFIPPASVGIKKGCGADILINICLWVLGWIPGVIHAWWIISKNPSFGGEERRQRMNPTYEERRQQSRAPRR